MGLECCLLRVEGCRRAREGLKSVMAERICTGVANLIVRLDGCRELCGTDSQHRSARAV